MGNDEHSQNVFKKARRGRGSIRSRTATGWSASSATTWARLDISFDDFIRTTEPRHKAGVTELAQRIYDAGDIYEGVYEGWYCVGCEAFKQEKDLVDGTLPAAPDATPRVDHARRTTSSGCRSISSRCSITSPRIPSSCSRTSGATRSCSLLEGGLEDISVSRAGQSWGIPLPFDPASVVYVWFDALINYASAVGFGTDHGAVRRSGGRPTCTSSARTSRGSTR